VPGEINDGEAYGRSNQPLQAEDILMKVAGKKGGHGHGGDEEFDLMAVGI
jgi:hypothetical protein